MGYSELIAEFEAMEKMFDRDAERTQSRLMAIRDRLNKILSVMTGNVNGKKGVPER